MTTSQDQEPSSNMLRRNWRWIVPAIVAPVIVISTALAFANDNNPDTLTIVNDEPATSPSEPPPTSEASSPPTTPTSAPAAPPPTTAKKTCKNSFDSSCGAQKWSPSPDANAPLTAEVMSQSPKDPVYEDPVLITIRVKDPDANLVAGDLNFRQYQMTRGNYNPGQVFAHKQGCATRSKPFGEWTTPAKKSGSAEVTYEFSPAARMFTGYAVIEGASDACSFIRSNGTKVDPIWDEPLTAWFNPYASWDSWNVCFDNEFHVYLVKRQENCRPTTW